MTSHLGTRMKQQDTDTRNRNVNMTIQINQNQHIVNTMVANIATAG